MLCRISHEEGQSIQRTKEGQSIQRPKEGQSIQRTKEKGQKHTKI